jgi:hypothetical protein
VSGQSAVLGPAGAGPAGDLGLWEAVALLQDAVGAATVAELTGGGSAAWYLRQAALEAMIERRIAAHAVISIHRALLAGAAVPQIGKACVSRSRPGKTGSSEPGNQLGCRAQSLGQHRRLQCVAFLCLPAGVSFPDSPPYLSLDPSVRETVAGKTLAGTASGVFPNPAALGNTPEWRRAEFGASNGHSNARGIGRILSAITHDGVSRGVHLLSPKTIDLIFEEQANGIDLFLNRPMRWGIGYGLAPDQATESDLFIRPGNKTCYWGGWGGSFVAAIKK